MNQNQTESKHSPAPWRWDAQTGYIIDAYHRTVCGFDGPSQLPERTTDARLIAEAPVLLAFVQEIISDGASCVVDRRYDAPHGNCLCWTCERMRKAAALIVKVEGSAQ